MDKKKVKDYLAKAQNALLRYDKAGDKSAFTRAFNLIQDASLELYKSDWVSVEEGLPLYDEKVFVCNKSHPDDVWKSFRLEKKGTDVISVNLNKTLDVNGFVIHKGNIPITHWRRIEKLEE